MNLYHFIHICLYIYSYIIFFEVFKYLQIISLDLVTHDKAYM